jgi:hypothetical protein
MTIFQREYKTAINNILKDIYNGTEYWGKGEKGNTGMIKPITELDDPNWSNYNFINTHYSVRDEVVEPFVRQNGYHGDIEANKSYKDSPSNREYFRILWLKRHELFGPESKHAPEIIGWVNKTRGRGQEREDLVGGILNRLPFLDVEMRGAAGSSEDFAGTDAIINYKGKDFTAQIKPFNSYQVNDKGFFVNTKLIRKYTQDFLVFGKKGNNEYHIMIFWNKNNKITDGGVLFPKNDFFLAVNYKIKEKKMSYKINN